jgi:hypothetical protein
MQLSWKSFRNEAEVQRALEAALPGAASPRQVRSLLTGQGCECSEPVDGVVYCSAPARSHLPLVGAKWLMEFHFQRDELREITVRKGLTGP